MGDHPRPCQRIRDAAADSGFPQKFRIGMKRVLIPLLWALLSCASTPYAQAEEARIDDAKCIACHKIPMQTFKANVHGRAFYGEELAGCQSCHGGGAAHIELVGQEDYTGPLKIQSFKKDTSTPEDKNRPCLSCHKYSKTHTSWAGSAHDMGGVSCTNCHSLHTVGETVRPGICFTCHQTKRAQLNHTRNPMMPRGDGSKECVKCHDPHGGGKGPSLLKAASTNDTCYGCHSEKRGPFLWEHAPVRENCANCHDPHGTANANFLKIRPPYLCQSCHSNVNHPSQLFSGTSLPGAGVGGDPMRVVGKSCMNCHGLIHGSNHPSGARLHR